MTESVEIMRRAIGVEDVSMTKRFGHFVALDRVSLKVVPGTLHALLGENGAGKSTLVKCVMGYHPPDEGGVIVGGHEQTIANPRDAHALGLGMVYQHFTLVPAMTDGEPGAGARPGTCRHRLAPGDKGPRTVPGADAVPCTARDQGRGPFRRRAAEMRDPQAALS
jgi:energy-coupling factor transporter ATP-binding protein EcfA2